MIGWRWDTNMKYLFSKSTLAFYPEDMLEEYKNLPDDLVEVSEEESAIYMFAQPPMGKVIGANKKGKPVWEDAAELSDDEQLMLSEASLNGLLNEASVQVGALQDIIDGYADTEATEKEKKSLASWKKYRANLSRVKSSEDWPKQVIWPDKPE